jgi:hypothetical protein
MSWKQGDGKVDTRTTFCKAVCFLFYREGGKAGSELERHDMNAFKYF